MAMQSRGRRWLVVLILLALGPNWRPAETAADSPAAPAPKENFAQGDAGAQEIVNSIGMKLRSIRAGNFRMGSPETDNLANSREKPQHRVRITKPFLLGKYEVTRGEYRKFMEATGHTNEAATDGIGGYGYTGQKVQPFTFGQKFGWLENGFAQTDEHPVVNVSWNDAVDFCRWLSKKENAQYRLPSEAEWEWAARAGSIERFSFGDDPDDLKTYANLSDTSLRDLAQWNFSEIKNWNDGAPFTSPVGKFTANQFGLHDMHGNVWEWCQDWYDETYYAKSPFNNPHGPLAGSQRVYRGGCWYFGHTNCRSAARGRAAPSYRGSDLGFRVVREAAGQ